MLIAAENLETWPDSVDLIGLLLAGAVIVGLPLLGYIFMVADYRAYLRSLRRAMVIVRGYATALPYWVVRDSAPPCLQTFGLRQPCTREQVLHAYREKVKTMHPDAGGSREGFAKLQAHFEQALQLIEDDSGPES